MPPIAVNVENFARAETDRMFASIRRDAGAINRWRHVRAPTPIEDQPVIRQNRDTLYSAAVFDATAGVTIELPEMGDRYASVMIIDGGHYLTHVLHSGTHVIPASEIGTPFAVAAARILVDASDPADVAAVNALQDRLVLSAPAATDFQPAEYDQASLDVTRGALLTLARGISGFEHAFGRRDEVDPVRHLIGSAAGWGGLPEHEAQYINVDPGLPPGEYRLVVRDVPVDGFWSISLYNADGYFEANPRGAYNVNSVTAAREPDGSVIIDFGGDGEGAPNWLPTMPGWNYLVRLYQPRAEVLDGTWTFPSVEPSGGRSA